MSLKRWVVSSPDKETAAKLSEDCEIHPFLALMLVTRGITDAESVAEFLLGNDVEDDPFGFMDMDVAVDRIQAALDRHESIAVYGDYDADGVTATVLLYSYLQEKGANAVYYIPEREGEGYGLHKQSIDSLLEQGVQLIVTVDNGISAVDEIAYAAEKGIDVVVTDHHMPPSQLPNAVAVVDPHRADCGSQFKDYAGVGVAFKLVCALEGDTDIVLEKYSDLVAIGTLGDVMLINGENRALVRAGIQRIDENKRLGIQYLRKAAGVNERTLTSTTVCFTLVPRINAAGRMNTPYLAARLLLTQQEDEAENLAKEIQQCNVQRQSVEANILKQVLNRIDADLNLLNDRVLVIDGENWHPGVIGIIAARIVDRFGKPCIMLSKQNGKAKGSGRSVKGFSLYDAIHSCSDLLDRYGGHELAAGVGLSTSNIEEFRRRINLFAAQQYPIMPIPELRIDFKLRPSQVNVENLNQLAVLEPFGAGNPIPVFGLFGMHVDNIMPLSKGKHVRLSLSRDNVRLSAIKFNSPFDTFPFQCGQTVNLVVTLQLNEYRGKISPSVFIKDIRWAEINQDELIKAFYNFEKVAREEVHSDDKASEWLPNRQQLAQIYLYIKKMKNWHGTLDYLWYCIREPRVPYLQVWLSLEILKQAGLITAKNKGDAMEITVVPTSNKTDLTATPVWQYLTSQVDRNEWLTHGQQSG